MEMQYIGVGIVMWLIVLVVIWKMTLGDMTTALKIGISLVSLPLTVGATYITLNR